jgi:hypothetical protein
MGGNTYNRRYFSDSELQHLISKVNGYQSLFDKDRVFDNKKQWRANISRHLDSDSCNRFYFLLAPLCYCAYCKKQLGIDTQIKIRKLYD